MVTQEIPSHEWGRFFDEFTRKHNGWLVTIELLQEEIGNQMLARDLPLDGLSVESNEVGEFQITIMVGARPNARITHTIAAPRRVWLRQNDSGEDDALEIQAFSGSVLLSLRSTSLPEFVASILAAKAKA